MTLSGLFPWIDDRQRAVGGVANVARHERQAARDRYCTVHGIGKVDIGPPAASKRLNSSGAISCRRVKGQNSARAIRKIGHEKIERGFKLRPLLSRRRRLNPVSDFQYRYGGNEQLRSVAYVRQPNLHGWMIRKTHHCRKRICIEDQSKPTSPIFKAVRLSRSNRSNSIQSSAGISIAAWRVTRPSTHCCPVTASKITVLASASRIARLSASSDRPFRFARAFKRCLASSARPRTTICPKATPLRTIVDI